MPSTESTTSKICTKCGTEKPIDCFLWRESRKSHASRCKDCAKAHSLQWYHQNKEAANRKRVDWDRANREKAKQRTKQARERKREIAEQERAKLPPAQGMFFFERLKTPPSGTKVCTGCGKEKLIFDFLWNIRSNRKNSSLNSHCSECRRAYNQRIGATGRIRAGWLRRKYGISLSDYEAMLAQQDRRCAICKKDRPGGQHNTHFHVDHDHKTGKVRGLLCANCNQTLGFMGDDLAGVMRFVEYLRATTPDGQMVATSRAKH